MSLTVIVLSDYSINHNKPTPTVRKIMKSCKKRNIPFYGIRLGEAFVVDSDVFGPELTIHNFDGEGKVINIPKKETVCIARGGAIAEQSHKALMQSLQEAGVFMVNDYDAMETASNKFATAIKLRKNGIPSPKTSLVTNEQSIPIALKEVGNKFPVIIKTIKGSKGIGVMKVESQESLTSVLQGLWKLEGDLILQEYLKIDYDIRSIVVDNEIIASVKRLSSNKGDFRTNKSLGNETEPYKLSEDEKKFVLRAHKASGLYWSGVDHVLDNDGVPQLLEINSSPGTSSDKFWNYKHNKALSGDSIIDDLIEHISDKKNWDYAKTTAGVVEWVKIEGQRVKAKFDTGNWTGGIAIDAQNIKEKNGKVTFDFNGNTYTKKILKTAEVRDGGLGGGKLEDRIYVEMNMSIGNKLASPSIFNLDDRSKKQYKVLVNKDWMIDNNYNIDSSKKFMLGESKKRVSTFREMYI